MSRSSCTDVLIVVDQLAVAAPSGGYMSLAHSMRESGVTTNVICIADYLRNHRTCLEGIRQFQALLHETSPGRVFAFGQSSVEFLAIARKLSRRRLIAGQEWIAVHLSSASLLKHQGPFRVWAFRQFDRHLIYSSDQLASIQNRFPRWRVNLLAWDFPKPSTKVDRVATMRELDIPENAKLAGISTWLQPRSRVKDFIWAGDLMRCIRDDVYWLVIGEGPQRRQLEQYANCLEIGDRLQFVECNERSADLLSILDVYVETSDWYDSSNGLLHALANHVPIVATTSAAHRNFVQSGVNGFSVERGARNEIARCVNRLVNRPDIAARFSEGSNRVAAQLFRDHDRNYERARLFENFNSQAARLQAA